MKYYANNEQTAYQKLGKTNFYDGMITCTTQLGTFVSTMVWSIGKKENDTYLNQALSGIPDGFSGKLLEVPVGTGILTMPLYQTLPEAVVICLDYSSEMMAKAKKRADALGLSNTTFVQDDVGNLPFEDETFDVVLSLNGFHAFPDKTAAYSETYRVLKKGGIFCGCFYIIGENKRTDWFIKHIYVPKGFFTPPFETKVSLYKRLCTMYEQVDLQTVQSIACFTCRKR